MVVMVIENKIGTKEHSNQLERYMRTVEVEFPGFERVGIFLTPDGTLPSSVQYLAIDYGVVADAVDGCIERESLDTDPAVGVLMRHYVRMLRRHVVADSNVARMCRELYRQHKQALDLIFEHQPRFTQSLIDFIKIDSVVTFKAAPRRGEHVQFTVPEWDIEELTTTSWRPAKRILLFQFNNHTDHAGGLELVLLVGPGDGETRKKLIEQAQSNNGLFLVSSGSGSFAHIWHRTFLTEDDVVENDVAGLEEIFAQKWSTFVEQELPTLEAAIDLRPTLGLT
jgi:hypothetical protein